ncbi:MAG: ABC transporter permease subunit [Gimesia sp.]
MFQGMFALFNRALCVDFRLTRTHLFRFLFAVMILFSLMMAHTTSRMIAAAGLVFFSQIIYLNFVFILMAGISFFATAITEEKEEQTIGLLLMAGVSPISLLLGKSLPRLISALLLLSVQFPFTLLAITLGGVTFSQVIAAYSALAAFLFCVANLGLVCSVFCARSRSASTLVVISLLFYFLGLPLFKWALSLIANQGWVSAGSILVTYPQYLFDWLGQFSVLTQVNMILITGFNESPWGMQFWGSLIFGGVLFFK